MIAVSASINIEWTQTVVKLLGIARDAGGLSGSASTRPVDCLISLSTAFKKALLRTLVSLFVPGTVMTMFAAFWGYWTIKHDKGMSYFYKRTILSIIAVVYVSYLDLTKLGMGVFYCLVTHQLDDDLNDSTEKYWAGDTIIKCYGKDHTELVFVGLITLLFVSTGYPTALIYILSRYKEDLTDDDNWIVQTMGFLYRPFKNNYLYWESIVMLRKALLSIIVVFSYSLGGQIQGLLSLIVLQLSFYIHVICLPFRKEFYSLNFHEAGSLLVSCLTFVLVQFFDAEKCSETTRQLVSLTIVLLCTLFVAVMVWNIFWSYINQFTLELKVKGIFVPEGTPWWKIIRLYVISVLPFSSSQDSA